MSTRMADLQIGDSFTDYYVISDIHVRSDRNGRPFLTASLSDASGSLPAKMWDYSGPLSEEDNARVVKVQGSVTEFNAQPQVTIRQLRAADERDAGRYRTEDLLPCAPIDTERALADVRELTGSISDPDYRRAAQAMLERHMETFRTIPAAKSVHHEYLHGLLMHTAYMLRTADYLADLYSHIIDRSLLLAGTLLHDLAKDKEFSFSPLGLVSGYTVSGDLLGHLYLGAQETADICRELEIPEEKSVLLQHMILSHHGDPEFGACVPPRCAESELLSMIDRIDSRMEIYTKACESVPEGSFSAPVFSLGKSVYRHFLTD